MYEDSFPEEWLGDSNLRQLYFDRYAYFPIGVLPHGYDDDEWAIEELPSRPAILPTGNKPPYDPSEEEIVITGKRRPSGGSSRSRPRSANHGAEPGPTERAVVDQSTSLLDRDTGRSAESMALSQGNFRTIKDPRLRGVNEEVRRRLSAFQSAGEIAYFLEGAQPGLGREVIGQLNKTVAFRKANPRVSLDKYTINLDSVEVPMNAVRSAVNHAAQTAAGAYVINAADAVTAGLLAETTENPALARAGIASISAQHPWASATGTTVGSGLASALGGEGFAALGAGRLAPVFGNAGYEMLSGALSDKETPLRGATVGMVGGLFAPRIMRQALRFPGGRPRPLTGVEKYIAQGHSPALAEYLALPYKGRGHHAFPLRRELPIIGRHKLPDRFMNSPFNVLKPKGITRGDFYELHYKVDPSFNVARLPARFGGDAWSGEKIGLQKYGQIGRLWYGTPTQLKAAAAGSSGLLGTGGYLLMTDDDTE